MTRTGKELGVDDYLVKPFEVDDLVVAMENKLRRLREEVRHKRRTPFGRTRQQFLNLISPGCVRRWPRSSAGRNCWPKASRSRRMSRSKS